MAASRKLQLPGGGVFELPMQHNLVLSGAPVVPFGQSECPTFPLVLAGAVGGGLLTWALLRLFRRRV